MGRYQIDTVNINLYNWFAHACDHFLGHGHVTISSVTRDNDKPVLRVPVENQKLMGKISQTIGQNTPFHWV